MTQSGKASFILEPTNRSNQTNFKEGEEVWLQDKKDTGVTRELIQEFGYGPFTVYATNTSMGGFVIVIEDDGELITYNGTPRWIGTDNFTPLKPECLNQ
ncbi:MAG: hypothetical protein M3Q64_02085 [bacterium]|nr:hypothetical protein [bacterium]